MAPPYGKSPAANFKVFLSKSELRGEIVLVRLTNDFHATFSRHTRKPWPEAKLSLAPGTHYVAADDCLRDGHATKASDEG